MSPPGRDERRDDRKNLSKRDERDVDRDDVEAPRVGGQHLGRQRSGVGFLEDDHSWIGAQPPVELPMTDVERDDAGRAVAEQHIGESPGRGADVECQAAFDGDAEGAERVFELEPAPADVRMIGFDERDRRVHADRCACLAGGLTVDAHLAGED